MANAPVMSNSGSVKAAKKVIGALILVAVDVTRYVKIWIVQPKITFTI